MLIGVHNNMASEIRLVQEIEACECLYNYSLPEYNRKDLADEAWNRVAANTNLTVNECKEKWRNIRSSYSRNLKPTEKARKPYYLAPYLQFILPFMRPSSNPMETKEEGQNENYPMRVTDDSDLIICSIKSEKGSPELEPEIIHLAETNYEIQIPEQSIQTTRKSQKRKCVPDESGTYKMKNRFSKNPEEFNKMGVPKKYKESMQYFLMSILSEFDDMSPEQIRLFKIKVMLLIDDIKTNFEETKINMMSSSETERLQKKLINLLIKSMQKRS